MRSINIGLIGAGTIGIGVIDSVIKNGGLIAERTGVLPVIRSVCDTNASVLKNIIGIDNLIKTTSADAIIGDKEIDIVVELIGGVYPAKEIVLAALTNRKHVVTANKALLSEHWKEIFTVASKNSVFVGFEASVGGGIPVIRVIRESFVSNNLEIIYGILNGTTNFVLTMMAKHDHSFDKALSIAQKKGFAESDPRMDISGRDSAHKLTILSLLGFGVSVIPDDIYTEGIEAITPQDIRYAEEWGYSIKLLAIAKNTRKGLQLRVHPTLIPSRHLLAGVNGENNAVYIKGDFVGESLFYGKGAGADPTASSVMSDIVEIAKHVVCCGKEHSVPGELPHDFVTSDIVNIKELILPYYLRFSVIDKPGVLSGISSVLSENDISIASMSQEERKVGETVPVIMLTHKACEGNMRKAIEAIDKMDFVMDKTMVIRVEM
ncbi:MAG: homoserine dehydrogenase [Candidatus Omnitrophica bacterium]|nr:homoserine dehydrogenase [Candidatus Omnitrophota bacterium]MBU1128937.1 homoserine dehydrogenase [Candidatus Omnitrophota bacterium]MBU1785008.1 homoserine dehydrogenase [Candidatus Omnitrophota bacterium]MBU1851908.1 homoserine dehydrogenase [Candidatus Omnitrophota bacterium]